MSPLGETLKVTSYGPYPQYGWDFPEETPENSRKTPETLSERFLEFPSRVRLGAPKPYISRHLSLPEHFQNSLPLSTAGDPSFFRRSSGEGLSELIMEFPAVLRAFLILVTFELLSEFSGFEGFYERCPSGFPILASAE